MKKHATANCLPLLVLCAGGVGALARWLLYRTAVDEKGLLIPNHPLHLGTLALSAATVLGLWLLTRRAGKNNRYDANFPKNNRLLPLAVIAAAGTVFTLITSAPQSKLDLLWLALGALSVPAWILIGLGRARGKQPKSWLYGVLCLFYAVHLVCCYQIWSGNPQTQDYLFSLLACGCLTLSAYQRCAFSVRLGNRRLHLFFCLMAGYFCVLCAPGSEHPWLYLTGGTFFLGDLSPEREVPHEAA